MTARDDPCTAPPTGFVRAVPLRNGLHTPEEVVLGKALTALKEKGVRGLPRPRDVGRTFAIPEKAIPYLQRMRLDAPRGVKERLLQRVVVYALAAVDAI